uniref:EF-hand domain-containing protein n=1 Tax=Chromera velia CCMP2878 TaxID=1169474 RepID=A0A0G4GRK5_9ALVE|mmetsp:Transcript_38690/g.76054  ORF Transcript_38690/g.76054 Transcript_38690/m.76054 type:complete len:252 (+) Transcript_38690:117-872(+)|eukprot:Cvel_23086.t1-p1 / transcript=Cvel_23086.t1 / gene=Cvel_23086 / organism=Chromera_velia_CCMP2878 / gene_product=hypothetical protein / transcript_product=hypothetical protein / location=Cvel_scaffold2339:11383-16050(+) / protein_length=251 / sequence_SO=supercontig / SO=protein_coding / is_pseudo=false
MKVLGSIFSAAVALVSADADRGSSPFLTLRRRAAFSFPELELIKVFGRLAEHDVPEGMYEQKIPGVQAGRSRRQEPWALAIKAPRNPGYWRSINENPFDAFAWDTLFPRKDKDEPPLLSKRTFADRLSTMQFRWPMSQPVTTHPEGQVEARHIFREAARELQISDLSYDEDLGMRPMVDRQVDALDMDLNALSAVFNVWSDGKFWISLEEFEQKLYDMAKASGHSYIDYPTFKEAVIKKGRLLPYGYTSPR